ncbi:bifunctional diguanylate cyclase/phosphodiesterase [Aquibacillus rhizosphaerae]|uniref:EAL domain-containing protein n=1 Tax=Aquibacillus rhizosphaerae TaxID=3051431 RepID=A0ABT7L4W2_9BACI|nr:EAL domain-containing protein [Aquibacillus sp. LR5S19]MDL4839635.1 EAL domain-containing protein [Aquibacillus sp. LR5S19]
MSFLNNETDRINEQVVTNLQELKRLNSVVEKHSDSFLLNETDEPNHHLKDIIEHSPFIESGQIIDNKGNVLVTYPKLLNYQKDLLKIKKDTIETVTLTQEIEFSEVKHMDNKNYIVLSIPVITQKGVEQIVNFSVELTGNFMFQSITDNLHFDDNSYGYVLDHRGKVIFHPKNNQVGSDKSSDILIQAILSRKSGFEELTNSQGTSYYVSYQYIHELKWTIVSLIPVEKTLLLPREFNEVLIPIFILLSIVLFLITTVMMHRAFKPLTKLFNAVQKVSRGDYSHRIVDVDGHSEIGSILAKFNVMVTELDQTKQTVRKKTRELKREKNFLNRVINHSPSVIYAMNWSGEFTIANKQFASLFNLKPEDIIGKKEEEFNPNIEDARHYLNVNREIMRTCQVSEVEGSLIDINGLEHWFHIGKVPIKGNDDEDMLVLCVAADITDRKKQEELIRHQAFHDELTGMPNRKMFKERLKEEITKVKNNEVNESTFALLFLDLDRFKYINDTFGHEAGDSLLQMVSDRLNSCISVENVVFRLGGDEFTIIVPDVRARQEVADLSKDILSALSAPYIFKENKFIITASIGISIFPDDGHDAEFMTKYADIAMYQAKEQGKNTFRFYTADMETELSTKIRLEMDLYQALKQEELFIHYQPITSTESDEISGMEALLRWEHPKLGLISPAEFIPIAEQTGLIHTIGEWVLRSACMQSKQWQKQGHLLIKVAVNLSPVQLKHPTIVESVQNILQESELPPEWLELEITESTIMENKRDVVKTLKQIRRLGVSIAIDDFGNGYSSLNALKRLPIDTLKIDRTLVQNLLEDGVDEVILGAVFDMAEKMNLTVVAEGIETEEQYNYLKHQYCQYVQGFLFSQPLNSEDFLKLYSGEK